MNAPARRGRDRSAPCPTCGRAVGPATGQAPFCSRRCRLVDLGRWLRGEYRIPGEESLALGAPEEGASPGAQRDD